MTSTKPWQVNNHEWTQLWNHEWQKYLFSLSHSFLLLLCLISYRCFWSLIYLRMCLSPVPDTDLLKHLISWVIGVRVESFVIHNKHLSAIPDFMLMKWPFEDNWLSEEPAMWLECHRFHPHTRASREGRGAEIITNGQ